MLFCSSMSFWNKIMCRKKGHSLSHIPGTKPYVIDLSRILNRPMLFSHKHYLCFSHLMLLNYTFLGMYCSWMNEYIHSYFVHEHHCSCSTNKPLKCFLGQNYVVTQFQLQCFPFRGCILLGVVYFRPNIWFMKFFLVLDIISAYKRPSMHNFTLQITSIWELFFCR